MFFKHDQLFALTLSICIASCLATADEHRLQSSDEETSEENKDLFHHHNYEQMVGLMNKVNKKCPEITRIYNLSEPSVEGRNLTVIEVTENPGVHVPGIKYIIYILYTLGNQRRIFS